MEITSAADESEPVNEKDLFILRIYFYVQSLHTFVLDFVLTVGTRTELLNVVNKGMHCATVGRVCRQYLWLSVLVFWPRPPILSPAPLQLNSLRNSPG